MTIYLHIGTHKTATTSLQHFFHINAEALLERGVSYPSYRIVGCMNHYAHLGMANALVGDHDLYSRDDARRFFREVSRRAKDHDITVLSGEPFYRQMDRTAVTSQHDPVDDYWTMRRAYIEQVAELLPDAEVVVVFRRQAEFAESLYQETIKKTVRSKSFRDYLQQNWYHFVYADQADAWAEAFPALSVLTFEELCKSGQPELAFCHALGIDTTGLELPEKQNVGLPVDAVILKRFINRFSDDYPTSLERIDRILAGPVGDAIKAVGKRSYFPSARMRQQFQNDHVGSNARLVRFARLDGFEHARLMSTDFTDGTRFGDQISPDVMTAIAKVLVSQ
jgi:hypothetical protein